jgi:hypothetical protein
MEASAAGVDSYTEASLYMTEGLSSQVKQGRLVFALTNASEDTVRFEVGASGGVYVSAVPEPSALALLLGGLSLLGAVMLRRSS